VEEFQGIENDGARRDAAQLAQAASTRAIEVSTHPRALRQLPRGNAIELGYYGIEVRFKGELRWWTKRVQQGRLLITYDGIKRAWHAHIASKVKLTRASGELKYGIDLGQEVLAAVACETGIAFLYKGMSSKVSVTT